jgi:hypothetical protein
MNLRIGPQPEEDRTRREEYNGFKYILKASDPYGFWRITSLKLNKTLDGQYTTYSEAAKAAEVHSNTLGVKA